MNDALIGVIVGGLIAAIPTAITLWLGKRFEERRQIRELAVSVALENFKIYKTAADAEGKGGFIRPIEAFLIHASHLVSAMDGSLKTDEQIRKHLQRGIAVAEVAAQETDRYNAKLKAALTKPAA